MATPIPKNRATFTLDELARATGGALVRAGGAQSVTGVVTDSRAVEAGNLYIALRGERHDGHAFVAGALGRGAAAVLISDRGALPQGAQASAVVCSDTLHALGAIAALHRKRWGGRVVAITGSAGKTTTKELTFAALRGAGLRVLRSSGNLNNLVGAPLTLLCLEPEHELCVLEIGTSAPGEIARLSAIAAPDVGVVVSVALAHTQGLGSLESVAAEKAALLWAVPPAGTVIYSADQAALLPELERVRAGQRIAFGRAEAAQVRLLRHQLELGATPSMRCTLALKSAQREFSFSLALFGQGPALDAAAAVAVVLALCGEAALEAAARGLAEVAPVPGRLEPVSGPLGSLVLDDSYNANPASMRSSIETALELARVRGGRALLVLGDMLELGQSSRAEHETVGKHAAQSGATVLVAVGVEMTAAGEAAREEARRSGHELSVAHLSDPAGAAQLVGSLLREHDVVLVKGSRGMAMECVREQLVMDTGGRP